MASKHPKLAVAPDGRIVDRRTGNVVRAQNLRLVNLPSGRAIVYRYNKDGTQGRLYGYIGKPTAKQQAEINRKAQNRIKRKEALERKQVRDAVKEASALPNKQTDNNGWLDYVAKRQRWKEDRASGRFNYPNVDEQESMNFATALNEAVDEGVMSIEDANERWEEFTNTPRGKDRSKLWDDLHDYFDEEGYKYIEGHGRKRVGKDGEIVDIGPDGSSS